VQAAAVVIVERGEGTVEFDQENSHAGKKTAERLLKYYQYTDVNTILSASDLPMRILDQKSVLEFWVPPGL